MYTGSGFQWQQALLAPAQDDFRPLPARRRILDAAREILREKSYEAFTLMSAANRAGYTRRTIYNQFEDRDALYRASRLELLERFEPDLPTIMTASAGLDKAMMAFFQAGLRALRSSEHRELHASVQRDGIALPWIAELYSKRVERPIRLCLEHHFLTRKLQNPGALGDAQALASHALALLASATTGTSADADFEPEDLTSLFLKRAARIASAG